MGNRDGVQPSDELSENDPPPGIYYSREADNFYSADRKGMGSEFYRKWKPLCDAFPRSPAGVALDAPAWNPEPPCWLVEQRKDGRTVAYLGHANGSYEWMPTPDKATRFVRREDANGVAECIDNVIVAEHIWG
jgi:hypothetical protein